MNKKGQDPYTLIGAVLGIILLIAIIPSITNAFCQDEKAEIERLTNQLSVCQGSEQETNQTLINCQNQLTQLSQENDNLRGRLIKLQEELDTCQASKEYFPLFWLTNIGLTKSWIIILNISLGLSIISIFNIMKWILSSNKKRKYKY